MDKKFLSDTVLFRGIEPEEVQSMLECLKAKKRWYRKGEMVFRAGERTASMGVVLSGVISIEIDDVWGNKSLLSRIEPGQIFGETYACLSEEQMMVNAVAAEDSEVLFLDTGRIMELCPQTCPYHGALMRNLVTVLSQKNLGLSRRMIHLTAKSIRGRLSSYLSYESVKQGKREFMIPYNRQQLADYLNVDRSALSNELSKMQREGLLWTEKNRFCLLDADTSDSFFMTE